MDLDEKKPDFVVCGEQKRIPVCASAPCADPGILSGGGVQLSVLDEGRENPNSTKSALS